MRTETRICLIVGIASVLHLSPSAGAQEQTGSAEGIVRDQQLGIVVGASVEARNLAVGSTLEAITDGAGRFRFATLAPGFYDITALLVGFRPTRFEHVEILLGQIKQLDFTLLLGTMTETVNASPTSPLLDVKQSARGYSLRQDQLAYLPRGRDYTSVVQLFPGTNLEPKLGGISVDGSSAAENRFLIDGIDTTHAVSGLQGQSLNLDSVEEVQIKSSGYAAEYGGATGGIINVLTKSGTNAWHGDASVHLTGSALDADSRPTLQRNGLDSSQAEYVTYPKDPYHAREPGFSLAGPIKRDRAWFFLAYEPLLQHTERSVTFALDGSSRIATQDVTRNLLNASQTLQLGPRLRTRASFNHAPTRTNGLLPALTGSDSPVSNFDVVSHEPNWTATGTVDFVASPRLLLSGRAGYTWSDIHTDNVRSAPTFMFQFSNVGLLDVPPSLQRVTGFTTDTNNFDSVKDRISRVSTEVDATWYLTRWGAHALKVGVQAGSTTNDADKGSKANSVGLFWNRTLLGQEGTYGFYQVTSNSIDPRRGSVFIGKAEGRTAGLFIQDAWTVGQRLTLNAGLRTERETVPRYAKVGGDISPIIAFGFGQKLAPRLGIAYDLRGDGLWKIYGSWGVFYDIFKYTLSTAFAGLDTDTYSFTLDTPDWTTLLASPACPPACPGRLILKTSAVNDDTSPIDPGLDPMRLQEAVAGVEHQVRRNLLMSVRYVHKHVDRAIEDIGTRDANANEIYTVGNPGFGRASVFFPDVPSPTSLPLPNAVRNYDALEVSLRRPLAGRWGFGLSYVWSRLFGNYSGLSQSDHNGAVLPNLGRDYDYPLIMFNERGQPNYGRLATDRPHQVKGTLLYSTTFGLSASAFQYIASGLPVTRVAIVLPPSDYPMQYLGRMSDGRTPMLSQTDVYVQQEIARARGSRLSVGVSVANLFNQDTVLSNFSLETEPGAGLSIDEGELYARGLDFQQLFADQKVLRDPRFLMPNTYQAPRTARVMLKWSF